MKLTKIFNKLAATALCAMSLIAANAYATPAFTVEPYSIVENDPSNYDFIVDFTANQAITVDALAYFFNTADVTGSHAVTLFDMSGKVLAETVVGISDILLGNFRYSSINPVNLLAGSSYRLVGQSNGGLYGWSAHSLIADPAVSFIRSGYSYTADNANVSWGDPGATADSLWGPNLSFSPTSSQVPEPATYALFIAGLGLLFIASRRKSS